MDMSTILAGCPDQSNSSDLDLDIRVVEYPQEMSEGFAGGTDYLTCKTDSTCDGSDAC